MPKPLDTYQYLIEVLAPMQGVHDFDAVFEDKTQDLSDEVRFLITMEIKRLAQPCIKSIDLRIVVDDDCKPLFVEGVEHHLSNEGNELFEYLLAQYQSYTIGVYEGVVNYFEKQRDITLGKTKKQKPPHENSAFAHTYISPVENLLRYPSRHDERLKLNVEVRVFLSASVLLCATSMDISRQGLKICLDDETELTLIKGFRPVQIVFVGLGPDSKLHKTPIEYKILGISKGEEKANIHLTREWSDGPKLFNDYLDEYLTQKRALNSVDTSNTQIAIESKLYEQAFTTNCQGLSLYINTENRKKPWLQYACVNDHTIDIFDYWQDEKGNQTLGYLFNDSRLTTLINESDTDLCTILYCFNHVSAGKVYFYSATSRELEQNSVLKDVFLSYASRKVSWRVYKLSTNEIKAKDAFVPSSLPNGINREINQDNRPLSPRLTSILEPLSHLVTMTDITDSIGQKCYQQRELDKDKIRLLSVFGHAKNKLPKSIDVYKFVIFDKRRERRYKVRTDIIVHHNKMDIVGVSEDISVQGLRLELDSAVKVKANTVITVSFPRLQKRTSEFDLQDLPYQVMRVSDDGYILHLQTAKDEKADTAKAFFKMLIAKNKDKLQVLESEQATPGLRQALRVLQAKFSPQVCVYTRQQKDLHLPTKTSINRQRCLSMIYLRHKMPVNYLNFSAIFNAHYLGKQYVATAVNHAKRYKFPLNHEFYIAYDSSQIEAQDAVTCRWEPELASHVEKYGFIKHAVSKGDFFACRVTSVEPQKPLTTLYENELKYLRKTEPKVAKTLESLAWSFSGQLFITDITSEVLLRYRLLKP